MQVLAGIEKAFGPDAFETAAAAKDVGAALKASSSYDDAERSYKQCISILQKIYGTEHPEVGIRTADLGPDGLDCQQINVCLQTAPTLWLSKVIHAIKIRPRHKTQAPKELLCSRYSTRL